MSRNSVRKCFKTGNDCNPAWVGQTDDNPLWVGQNDDNPEWVGQTDDNPVVGWTDCTFVDWIERKSFVDG